jgi:hypothetical protein
MQFVPSSSLRSLLEIFFAWLNWQLVKTTLLLLLLLLLYGPLLSLGLIFSFLNLYTVGRSPSTRDQRDVRPLPTHKTTQTQNKSTETSMPRVGFEPTIPAFERPL